MFVILGFQSLLMGLLAEILVRTYHEAQDKPVYFVRRRLNLDEGPHARSGSGA